MQSNANDNDLFMNEIRTCRICLQNKSQDEFYPRRGARNGSKTECKDCVKKRVKIWAQQNKDKTRRYKANWRLANPDRIKELYEAYKPRNKARISADPEAFKKKRANSLLYLYKITESDYQNLLSARHFRCEICKTHQDKLKYKLHIDHCHVTGKVRGLLCANCNVAMGLIKDDPDILLSAVDYLRRYGWGK